MSQTSPPDQSKTTTLPLRSIMGGAVLFVLYVIFLVLDDTTQLTPNHDGVLDACVAVGALSATCCLGLLIRHTKTMDVGRRIGLGICAWLVALILVSGVSVGISGIVVGLIDFPPGKTVSHKALLSIRRAYHLHRKGESWHIQTMPLWADLEVRKQDYEFMLAHRRPGDDGRNPDRISSQGYFCAQVTVEVAGNAVRVMHAGTHTLPSGTVIVCPDWQVNAAGRSTS
jgi:branched-subunit amino acid transport protein